MRILLVSLFAFTFAGCSTQMEIWRDSVRDKITEDRLKVAERIDEQQRNLSQRTAALEQAVTALLQKRQDSTPQE